VIAARHVNDRDRQYFSLQTRREMSANRKVGGAFCVLFSFFDFRLIGGLKKNAEKRAFQNIMK